MFKGSSATSCLTSNSTIVSLSPSPRVLTFGVVGFSGPEVGQGVGKSCLCQRFIRPHPDLYRPERISVLSETDFSGQVVNSDHWLYWGETSRQVEGGSTTCFRLIEQTEFVDDSTFRSFSKREPYERRCANVSLHSPGKLQFICKDQLGQESQFDQVALPDGKVMVDGFVCAVDVTRVDQRTDGVQLSALPGILNSLLKTKKPVVIATTKNDEANLDVTSELSRLLNQKAFKNIQWIHTSAKLAINVDAVFLTLAAMVERTKPKRVLPYHEALCQRNQKVKFADTNYRRCLSKSSVDYLASWDAFHSRYSNNSDVAGFIDLLGTQEARMIFQEFVDDRRLDEYERRLNIYLSEIPRVLGELLPDLHPIENMSTHNLLTYLRHHPRFSDFFTETALTPASCSLAQLSTGYFQPADRIPFSLLQDMGESSPLRAHVTQLRDAVRQEEARKAFTHMLHSMSEGIGGGPFPTILPGQVWQDVEQLVQDSRFYQLLPQSELMRIYDNFQDNLKTHARQSLNECLVSHVGILCEEAQHCVAAGSHGVKEGHLTRVHEKLEAADQRWKSCYYLHSQRLTSLACHFNLLFMGDACWADQMCINAMVARWPLVSPPLTPATGPATQGSPVVNIRVCAVCGDGEEVETAVLRRLVMRLSVYRKVTTGSGSFEAEGLRLQIASYHQVLSRLLFERAHPSSCGGGLGNCHGYVLVFSADRPCSLDALRAVSSLVPSHVPQFVVGVGSTSETLDEGRRFAGVLSGSRLSPLYINVTGVNTDLDSISNFINRCRDSRADIDRAYAALIPPPLPNRAPPPHLTCPSTNASLARVTTGLVRHPPSQPMQKRSVPVLESPTLLPPSTVQQRKVSEGALRLCWDTGIQAVSRLPPGTSVRFGVDSLESSHSSVATDDTEGTSSAGARADNQRDNCDQEAIYAVPFDLNGSWGGGSMGIRSSPGAASYPLLHGAPDGLPASLVSGDYETFNLAQDMLGPLRGRSASTSSIGSSSRSVCVRHLSTPSTQSFPSATAGTSNNHLCPGLSRIDVIYESTEIDRIGSMPSPSGDQAGIYAEIGDVLLAGVERHVTCSGTQSVRSSCSKGVEKIVDSCVSTPSSDHRDQPHASLRLTNGTRAESRRERRRSISTPEGAPSSHLPTSTPQSPNQKTTTEMSSPRPPSRQLVTPTVIVVEQSSGSRRPTLTGTSLTYSASVSSTARPEQGNLQRQAVERRSLRESPTSGQQHNEDHHQAVMSGAANTPATPFLSFITAGATGIGAGKRPDKKGKEVKKEKKFSKKEKLASYLQKRRHSGDTAQTSPHPTATGYSSNSSGGAIPFAATPPISPLAVVSQHH